MAETEDPTRRAFTGVALAAIATGAMTGIAGCEEGPPPEVVPATINVADMVVGEPLHFVYPAGHTAFMLKLGVPVPAGVGPDRDIVAYHRACPHMGCALTEINFEDGTLGPCACHWSLFDLKREGAQIYGRASQNLVRVHLEVDADGGLCPVGLSGLPYGEAHHDRWRP